MNDSNKHLEISLHVSKSEKHTQITRNEDDNDQSRGHRSIIISRIDMTTTRAN